MYVTHAALRKPCALKTVVATASDRSQASDEDSVNEATVESAGGWQTVAKKKKTRGGKGKGGNGAAGRKAAPAGNSGQVLVVQVDAVVAKATRGAQPQQQQQQQSAWHTQGNGAATQAQGQSRPNTAAWNAQFPPLQPPRGPPSQPPTSPRSKWQP